MDRRVDMEMILAAENNPRKLEDLYRRDKEGFARVLPRALESRPDSLLLRAWKQRLVPEGGDEAGDNAFKFKNWLPWLILAVLAGVGMVLVLPFDKLFAFGQPPDTAKVFLSSLGPSLVVVLMLLHYRGWPRPGMWAVLLLWAATCSYSYYVFDQPPGELWTHAQLHVSLPFFFVLGLAFLPGNWLDVKGWKAFVRFYGEFAAFGLLSGLGFFLVAILALTLFGQLAMDKNVYWYALFIGLALAQIWSNWMALHFGKWQLAPRVARVLAPLAALLFAAYLVCRFLFRVAFDLTLLDPQLLPFMHTVALMVALGLSVYCIVSLAGKRNRFIAAALVLLTGVALGTNVPFLIDLFSTASDPTFSVGALVLLGVNLILSGHLLLLLGGLLAGFAGLASMSGVEGLTVRYMPVYLLWSLFVILVVPWVF